MNLDYLEQLIKASEKVIPFLEDAIEKKDKTKIQQAKVFLYSIYKQINKLLSNPKQKND